MTDPALPAVPHWIRGAEHPQLDGRKAPVYDPARGVVTKEVMLAGPAEITAAVDGAQAAFAIWSGLSLARRQTVLFKFRELLDARASTSWRKSSRPSTARCLTTPWVRSAVARRASSSPPGSLTI